jgi:hypothetical protein
VAYVVMWPLMIYEACVVMWLLVILSDYVAIDDIGGLLGTS